MIIIIQDRYMLIIYYRETGNYKVLMRKME